MSPHDRRILDALSAEHPCRPPTLGTVDDITREVLSPEFGPEEHRRGVLDLLTRARVLIRERDARV